METDEYEITVYKDRNWYWYTEGHIDLECQYAHVIWTEMDLEVARSSRERVNQILSIYLS